MTDGIPWACPHCRGSLTVGPEFWACVGCGTHFPTLRGIPDLRTREDGYLPNAEDREFAQALDRDFDGLDFRGLLERFFELSPEVPPDLRARQVAHILTAPGRVGRWVEGLGDPRDGPWLDLGCGSGSFLAAVGGSPGQFLGVDIAMRWLLVARKRLDEAGLAGVPLACACAESLPLRADTVAAVVAGDVIEHVGDQGATLTEAYRVLRPGGRLFLASPNRYSLAPEPHVGVWGVGYLPRRWMARYVRAARGVDFRAIRTMGAWEWREVLSQSPFRGGTLQAPPLPPDDLAHFGGVKRWLARGYNRVIATGLGQRLAQAIGPLFHVRCEKPADTTP